MKKIFIDILLSGWMVFVISLYWLVTIGPGYYELANKYPCVTKARMIAMTWFYRKYIY